MSIRGRVSRNLRNLVAAWAKLGIATWALMVVGALGACLPAFAEELSVELQVTPRMQKGRISPYIFGAGIDAKTNPLRAPKYPEQVFRDIGESGLRIARYPGGFVFNRNDHRGSWANFYWQLGNEVHSYPQGFQENAAGAKEYAKALDRLVPLIRKMSPGAKVLVPLINIERPRSEVKDKPNAPDINFTTSHEFAVAFLENLNVNVDYFDWHFISSQWLERKI